MPRPAPRALAGAVAGVLAGAGAALLVPAPAAALTAATTVPLTVLSHSEFADPTGNVHVVGEVANTSGTTVTGGQVGVVAHAAAGDSPEPATTAVTSLLPGEVSSFATVFRPPAGYTGSSVTGASAAGGAPAPQHRFTTTITGVQTLSDGSQQVTGTVVNNDAATAQYVRVDLTVFDGRGTAVDAASSYPGSGAGATLAPGGSAPFTATRPAGDPAGATVSAMTEAQNAPAAPGPGGCPALRALTSATTPVAAGGYHPLPPARIMDTRLGSGTSYAGHGLCGISPAASLELQVGGVAGVPQNASAVLLTVTGTDASYGNAVAYPAGMPAPDSSNLNFTPGKTLAQLVQVPLGAGGRIALTVRSPHVDLVVDVTGYLDADSSGGPIVPVNPQRVADTRPPSSTNSTPEAGHPLGAGGELAVPVTGPAGIPAGAQAVVVNVTAVAPTATTYLTVFAAPAGSTLPVSPPGTSNVNADPGDLISDRVIAPVDGQGQIVLFNNAGQTNVVVDVVGYVPAGPATGRGQVHSLAPSRVADTRPNIGGSNGSPYAGRTLGPYGSLDVAVAGSGLPVPGSASAVLAVLTATDTATNGYALAYRPGAPLPWVSDVNWNAGRTVPNLVVVPVDPATGTIRLGNGPGTADLILDVVGYLS